MSDRGSVSAVTELATADAKILELFGIVLVSADTGSVTLAMTIVDSMINSQGICHGGFLYTLADTAAAYAAVSVGAGPTTVNATVAYLAPARSGDRVTAQANVLKAGSRAGHCDVRVARAEQSLAMFRSTWLVR